MNRTTPATIESRAPLNRVLVIGCSGSGKSTLSNKLGLITGLEVIHLDQHYHGPNWTEMPSTQWESVVDDLISKSSWIMDGNYGGTLHMRAARADSIIFLNYSTLICLWRVAKRTFKYLGKVRPDAANECRERFDLGFFHYVATYNLTRREHFLNTLDALSPGKEIVILRNDNEVQKYLQSIADRGTS